jgi:ATP-binding cassette subfamily B protein
LLASTALATLASCLALVMPLVLRWIVNGPIAQRKPAEVWLGGLALLVLGVAEASIFGIRRWLAARPLAAIEAAMREDLYRHVQELPVSSHDRWASGQLLSRATTDLQVVRLFLAGPMPFIVVNTVTIAAGAAILISQQWLLALIVIVTVPPLMITSARFERTYGAATRSAQESSGDLTTTVRESVLGIRVVKGLRQDHSRLLRFQKDVQKVRAAELGKAHLLGRYSAVIMAVPQVATAVALVVGAVQVAHGHLSAGALLAFLATVLVLGPSVSQIGPLLASYNDAAAATDRFFEVIAEPKSEDDRRATAGLPRSVEAAELVFESVDFRYAGAPASEPPVLSGVSLKVAPGETLALVGATGSGKSTLAALAAGLYEPVNGRITLDGVDIATLSRAELRHAVIVAFDNPTLFSLTVTDNVLMGHEAEGSAVDRALGVAHASEFVRQLPEGVQTILGENGHTLSGGQRQRLALARAIVREPRLLVLDDPLSALDIHTESQVHEALREVLATTTALVIAHRPATAQLADRVAVLRAGRIIAVDTHDRLLQTSPEYASLMTPVESDGAGQPASAAW